MEIRMIVGRPNKVGSARVYVVDGNDVELELVVRDSEDESERVVAAFNSPVTIDGTTWIVRATRGATDDLDADLPGAPIAAGLLVSAADD